MNWGSVALWGFVGSLVMTLLMAGCQGLGITRMNIPFLLGTMLTPDRDRAKLLGIGLHVINGWVWALLYAAIFESLQVADVWVGMLISIFHALFSLAVGMPILPAIHPRMASEQRGPTPTRQLEPPGFMALHYGRRTPISVLFAHLVFGAIQGGFYHLH